ncbi:MAG: response regulator [Rhodospirillales bacterium]|nr:response regulator [Alphaproteobacteria bacterium]MCB9981326.1 response regulator [Rhodospirillales bacterium]
MSKKKILVIDDNQTTLHIIDDVLHTHNFECIKANNGENGIEAAKTQKPNAILLDREMPGLNGQEVLKLLKKDEKTKNIPVIMLTGGNNINDVAKFLEAGAQDYIVKPFNNENLIMRLKNVIIP